MLRRAPSPPEHDFGRVGKMRVGQIPEHVGIIDGGVESAKPVSRVWVARANASRDYFIRTLIEVKADMSEVLNRTDAFGNLKEIARRFRVASVLPFGAQERARLSSGCNRE